MLDDFDNENEMEFTDNHSPTRSDNNDFHVRERGHLGGGRSGRVRGERGIPGRGDGSFRGRGDEGFRGGFRGRGDEGFRGN